MGTDSMMVSSVESYAAAIDVKMRMQVKQVSKQRLVLDLSCRKRDGKYYVVTDRWQRFSELVVDAETLSSLGIFSYKAHPLLPLLHCMYEMAVSSSSLYSHRPTSGRTSGLYRSPPD